MGLTALRFYTNQNKKKTHTNKTNIQETEERIFLEVNDQQPRSSQTLKQMFGEGSRAMS